MSSLLAEAAAESGMQEATLDSGAGSPAHAALPKLPSWSASGWQTLLKQPSAGTANLTDMLADLGQSGEGAQASGDASASPLFKWTSDGSMMEELMKAYKDSSPGTPTFGGGAPGNSLLRDGSLPKEGTLYKEGSLYKDGSITSCLQAAFQAQLEEEDQQQQHQATALASVPESPRQAADAQAAEHQQAPQPFAFVPMSADNHNSPQLHMPPPSNLEAQRTTHPPSQHAGSHGHPEYTQPTQPGTVRGQSHQAQLQQQPPQLQRRLPHLQPPTEGPPATAAPQLQPTWPDQLQYQFVNESMQQMPRQLPEQQGQQQQHHMGSIPVTANVISHPTKAQYDYPQLPPASQLLPPQGNQGLYPAVPAAVITSGAMGGPSMWGTAEGRSGSPALQPQGPSPGAGQASHLLHQADGSIQAVPRIIIRTSAPADPPVALNHSPPSQQGGYPVVLNSRVVREPLPDPPTRASPYAHWTAPDIQQQQQLQQYPQAQHGMHQYKAEQQSRSIAHAQQAPGATPAYMQQAPNAHPSQVQQHHQPPNGQLQYAPQQLSGQLPGQLPQQGHHHLPRPGSFQELLSAPLLPEQYNAASPSASSHHSTASVSHSAAQRAQRAQQAQRTQPAAAAAANQVLRQPPASAADTHTAQTGNPGVATMATSQHMFLSHHSHANQHQQQQQQQQQRLLGSTPYAMADRSFSTPLHLQTSSAMYPPIQYPQAVGAIPLLPKVLTDHPVGPGHPYHAYQTSPAAGGLVTQPQQLQQQLTQQQQQQQQLFQYAQQHHHHHARLPLQNTLHNQQLGGQVNNLSDRLTNPLSQHQATVAAATANAGSASPAQRQGQADSMTYNPPAQRHDQTPSPTSMAAVAYQAVGSGGEKGHLYDLSHAGSFLGSFPGSSHQSDGISQRPSRASSQHGHAGQNPSVTNPQDMYYSSQHRADAAKGAKGSGLVVGVVPGPPYAPVGQAGGPSPAGSADGSANQQDMSGASSQGPVSSATSTPAQSSLQEPHGTVLLTSHPVAPSQLKATGKVVSFAAASAPPHQQDEFVMPSIPSLAKENVQEQSRQHGPPPQPGRKFKRDRSSRKNSFSFPPVPPKKHASAGTEFSPGSSLEFGLHGAASAPVPAPDFSASLAVDGMPHSASCQDMAADALPSAAAVCTASGGKSSRSSSADVVFCAEGIDFNSRAWKNMSRKEKNRASAAASRARREAYTESLEDMVRKLQEERDWLQEQIDPGSMEKSKVDSDAPMQLPRKPPVRHLSL